MSIVVYSYAHIPLLMGLAAMSAGVRLLIARAGADRLGTGPSVALLGGVLLYLLGLIGTRTVVVHGPHRLGISLKLAAGAVLIGLIAAESVLSPVAVAAALAVLLVAVVVADRTLMARPG